MGSSFRQHAFNSVRRIHSQPIYNNFYKRKLYRLLSIRRFYVRTILMENLVKPRWLSPVIAAALYA